MINAYVLHAHHLDHVAPILRLVPHTLYVGHAEQMPAYARALGLEAHAGTPPAGLPVLVASGNELPGLSNVIFAEHGCGQTYMLEPGVPFEHVCWPGGPDRDAVGLFLCPNGQVAAKNLARYPDAAYAIVGSPHVEHLRAVSACVPGEDAVGIATHWESGPVPELRSGWSWFEDAYRKLAVERPVILHAHPRHQDWVRHCAREWGVPFAETFEALVRYTGLLITDNSSVLYEYAALDRPVVAVNPPWYRTGVEHGLRFWEMADVGPLVFDPADLPGAIERANAPGLVDLRRDEICRELFGDDLSDGAAQRAADAIATYCQ